MSEPISKHFGCTSPIMCLLETASRVLLTVETCKRLTDGGDEGPKQTALLGTQLDDCMSLICNAVNRA